VPEKTEGKNPRPLKREIASPTPVQGEEGRFWGKNVKRSSVHIGRTRNLKWARSQHLVWGRHQKRLANLKPAKGRKRKKGVTVTGPSGGTGGTWSVVKRAEAVEEHPRAGGNKPAFKPRVAEQQKREGCAKRIGQDKWCAGRRGERMHNKLLR